MAVVWMHIEKFGGVVKINDDHPLAVAERAKNPKAKVWRERPAVQPAPVAAAPAEPAQSEVWRETPPAPPAQLVKPKRGGKGAKAAAEDAAE